MANTINTVIESQAQSQVELLIKNMQSARQEIIKTSEEARKMNSNISGIKTPSGLSNNASANAQLIADMQKQSVELAKLQKQYTALAEVRAKSNQKTSEEIVNQRILATNANRQATATSTLAGAYRNLSAQVSIASEKYQNLIVRGKTAEQTQKQFNNELKNAQIQFRNLQSRVLEADKAVDKWGRTGERSIGFAKNLLSAFGVVGGITAAATITKDIFEQTKEMQSLDLALKTVTGTQEKFYESQSFLNRIAETYGAEINTLTTSFTQFYAAAKDKISGDQIKGIFESVTKSAGFLGLSVEKQEKAFLALNQMMSKGTIQAEELRGQLSEALPGSMGIMVKAVQALNPNMKVTEQTIAKMMKDGKLLASQVLPEFARQMEISYGVDQKNRVETLTASTTRMGNSWKELIRSLNDSDTGGISAFFKFFSDGTNSLIKGLTRLNTSWLEIQKKAIQEGLGAGQSEFKDKMSFLEPTISKKYGNQEESRKEIANQIVKDAESRLTTLRLEASDLQNRLKEELRVTENGTKWWKAKEGTLNLRQEIEKKTIDLNTQKGIIAAGNEFINPTTAKSKTLETGVSKENQKAQEDRLKLLYDNAKKVLEIEIYKKQKIYEDEKLDYRVRLEALTDYLSLKGQLTSLNYEEDVRLAKGNNLKIVGADLDKKFELIKNLEDYNDKREKLEVKSVNTMTENNLKEINSTDLLAESKKKATDELDKYAKKLKETEEQTKRLQDATDEFLNSFKDGFLSNAGLGSLQKFFDGTFNNLLKGADTLSEKFAVTFNAVGEVAQEAFAFISQASQKNFDEEYSRLEEQKNISIAYAGGSAEAKKKIEKDYEDKRREIADREAKAKQKQAIFNVVIDTAQAIASAVAKSPLTFGLPFSAVATGIGLAQIAVINSQQIPKYFKGGIHGGGLAMINDAGGSNYVETAVLPDGTARQYSGRNVIADLPAGTEIFTPEQMQAKLMKPDFELKQRVSNNSGISDGQVNKIVSAVQNIPNTGLGIHRSELVEWVEYRGNRTVNLNDRVSYIGKKV